MKTKRIGLIVTEEEKNWVIQLAEIEGGLSQASLVRRLIHKAAIQYSLNTLSNIKSIEEKDNEQPTTKV